MKNIEAEIDKFFSDNRGIVSQSNIDLNSKLSEIIPFNSIKYLSGYQIERWKIPLGWELKNGEIKIGSEKYDNFDIPLLVPFGTESFSYSGKYKEIKRYIISIPELPHATPYRTNYYNPSNHMVCVPYNILSRASNDTEISINVESSFTTSNLEILEILIKGEVKDEVLFTTYNCHPGLGNDNFSGIISICNIYDKISRIKNRYYSYRFAIFPETIGAICYIESLTKRGIIKNILFSTVLTCLGGTKENYTFKDSPINSPYSKAYKSELQKLIPNLKIYPYTPDGSDERQFSSPNVGIPSGSLCRNRYYEYKEYHTSLDTFDFMNKTAVNESCNLIFKSIKKIDSDLRIPKSSANFGEPFLSSYDLDFHSGGAYNANSDNTFVNNKKITNHLISGANGNISKEELIINTSKFLNINCKVISEIYEKLLKLGILFY